MQQSRPPKPLITQRPQRLKQSSPQGEQGQPSLAHWAPLLAEKKSPPDNVNKTVSRPVSKPISRPLSKPESRPVGQKPLPFADRPARLAPRPPLPALNFPEQLPVSGKRNEIAQAIMANRVVIVCGETGSGKTTQLPKIAWEAGRGRGGLIGHTQPRRLAATSVAKRIAQELKSAPGEYVGYKIRFNEQITPGATIKLMTDGVLLAETLSDPLLKAYDTLIVDEAHERSLNIDFLLGYLKQLLDGPRRDTLKLIITSATIDARRFAEHFGEPDKPAPVIEVSGRLFPVEIRYQPLNLLSKNGIHSQAKHNAPALIKPNNTDDEPEAETDEVEQTLPSAIADAASLLWREGPGDILVFLPGEREIRDAMEYLRKWDLKSGNSKSSSSRAAAGSSLEVLALFSRLSAADQERVFSQSKGRRIVLATNVAETSLTVPGVRYVIDAGLARMKRYRYRTKVEQLQVEKISQAAANQRAGRCGRVADGICIRLYAEDDYLKRPRFTDPEVLRSSLAAVILRMKALRLSDIEDFPFLDLPPRRAILDGYALLQELQALDDSRAVTAIGKQLAKLPLDPRIARMLLAAHELHCLPDVLIIASGLSVQDPRERPMDAAQAADQKHLRFVDEKSDFIALLKVWRYWRSGEGNKESNRIFQEQLKREFISPRRLREWADVHSQLREAVQELGWIERPQTNKAEKEATTTGGTATVWDKALDAVQYEKIHRALLAGLLGNLGLKGHESNVYLGTHEIKFQIHPGSGLAKKGGRWLMAAELVDTHKLYARNVAQVQPDWIESAAGHLIRRSCSDAHWEKKAAQVVAVERGVLYGLPIYSQRRVHFGPINPELSRELMIRGALVALDWDSDLSFFKHNQRLIADIESLEHKIRRPDLLVDEQLLYAFFDASVPADVVSGQTLTMWWRKANDAGLLKLSRDALMRKDVAGISSDSFPRTLRVKGNDCTLDYHFDPSSVRDGVSLTVPLHLLNQVDANRCEWLVPGMLKDKVLALIKSLPPKLRHRLQPFDAFTAQFLEQHADFLKTLDTASGVISLTDAIRDAVKEAIRLPVIPTDFRTETLASHAWMRFVVIDEHQRELAASRDLSALRAQLGGQAQSQFREQLLQAQKRVGTQNGGTNAPTSVPAVAGQPSTHLAAKADSRHGTNQAAKPKASAAALSTATVYVDWTFGELEELIETHGAKGERLIGYPGLVAIASGVVLQVFDDPDQARKEHLGGLRRLFAIQFKEQIKFFERHVPGLRDMNMQFLPLGSAEELKQQLVDIMLDRICLIDPLPVDAASFAARCEQSRGRIGLLAQEVGRLAASILTEYVAVQKKLVAIKAQTLAFADIDASVKRLCHKRFLIETPWAQLSHLPRYLKAAQLRIDKLRADPNRDAAQMSIVNPLQAQWLRAVANQRGAAHPRLEEYRWLLEELRVSLFAQELRTPVPVSAKRLEKVWQSLQN